MIDCRIIRQYNIGWSLGNEWVNKEQFPWTLQDDVILLGNVLLAKPFLDKVLLCKTHHVTLCTATLPAVDYRLYHQNPPKKMIASKLFNDAARAILFPTVKLRKESFMDSFALRTRNKSAETELLRQSTTPSAKIKTSLRECALCFYL